MRRSWLLAAFVLWLAALSAQAAEQGAVALLKDLKPGPHPYLLFSREEIPSLQAKMHASPTKELWERTREFCDRVLSRPCEPYPQSGYWEQIRQRSDDIERLSFACLMTGEQRYGDRAIAEIEALLAVPHWIETQVIRQGKLTAVDRVTARVASVVAQAYDWMYDDLPPELRRRMRQATVAKAIHPLVEGGQAGRIGWLDWYRGNWCIGGLGQIGMTSLAFLPEEPDAVEWAAYALDGVNQGLAAGCRDGGWGEGCQYYCVAWAPAGRFAKALKRLTRGEVDLFDHPFLRNVHQFPLYFLMPDREHFAPIGNCDAGPSHSAYFLVLLAEEYQNPYAQWLAGLGIPRVSQSFQTVFSHIFYDPSVPAKPPSDLPAARHFRDLDWACFRSGWDSPDDVWFTFKGGTCDWDHIHGDGNSFTLYAYGSPLLVDQGYPQETWGYRTEAHNTVRVNEQDQYPRTNPAGGARQPWRSCDLTEFVHTDVYDHIRGDATAMYNENQAGGEAEKAVREVMYIRPGIFVVFDEVLTAGLLPVDWSVHAFGDMTMEGNRITVIQDAAAADIDVLEPVQFTQRIFRKTFEEVGVRAPFKTATADSFIKIRPKVASRRTTFLTVIMPRRAEDKTKVTAERIESDSAIGVRIESGGQSDIALFATTGGPLRHGNVSAVGRSCFVRRVAKDVRFFALHQGTQLTVGEKTLFEAATPVESATGPNY